MSSLKPTSPLFSTLLQWITCIRMVLSNQEALKIVESVLGYSNAIYSTRMAQHKTGASLNASKFTAIHETVVYRLFYPFVDDLLFEQLLMDHTRPSVQSRLKDQLLMQEIFQEFVLAIHDELIIDNAVLQKLRMKVAVHPKIKQCVQEHKESLFHINFHLPLTNQPISHNIAQAFTITHTIQMDEINQNSDSLFESIHRQFRKVVEDPNAVSVHGLRKIVHDYSESHFEDLVYAVRVWRMMDVIWFQHYSKYENARVAAKHVLQDRFLMSEAYWPENYAIGIVLDHLDHLIGSKVAFIVLDSVNGISVYEGFEKGEPKLFAFLYSDNGVYSSFRIDGQRVFNRNHLPQWK